MILVSSCSLPGTPEPDEIRSEIRHRFSIPKQAECRAEDGLTESEAVALAHSKARLHIWLIMMAMIGITLGVFVTVVTVRREKRAAELKTDFVANVTHELKTPLTSIRLFIETLQLDHVESEEERAECLSIMARETDRLTRLIDRLLQFSKLDRRQWKLKLTYEDPVRLIEEAVQLYKEQHGVADVDIKVEALQTPKVTVDREAMIEVLYNLIHNAVKYTPSKGREIRVTIAERRRDVAISVVDNGVGEDLIRDWRLRFEAERHYLRHRSAGYDVILIALTLLFIARRLLRAALERRTRPQPELAL